MGWIADIGNLVSDWFGNDPDEDARHAQKEAEYRQQVRDDSAIRRRVADAKAAGIHPLFAMGGSVGGSSSTFMSGGGGDDRRSNRASSAAKVIERAAGQSDSALTQAQIRSLNADAARNEALAASEIARAAQAANHTRPDYVMETPIGARLGVTGSRTPAQKWQDEYGDIAENIMGTGHLIEDAGKAIAERYADQLDAFINAITFRGPKGDKRPPKAKRVDRPYGNPGSKY